MRTGIPSHSYLRSPAHAVASLMRSSLKERHGALASLQVAVIDGYPYYVAYDVEGGDEETWFDALTGGQIAGPHESSDQ